MIKDLLTPINSVRNKKKQDTPPILKEYDELFLKEECAISEDDAEEIFHIISNKLYDEFIYSNNINIDRQLFHSRFSEIVEESLEP